MNRIHATILAFGLVSGAASFAQGVPAPGTYESRNHQFSFEITSADPSNGVIQGTYHAKHSPVGPLDITPDEFGHYAWVFNDSQGADGVAPFVISFSAGQRPDGRPYAIVDQWNGAYRTDDSILASGSRSYVDSTGRIRVIPLGVELFRLVR